MVKRKALFIPRLALALCASGCLPSYSSSDGGTDDGPTMEAAPGESSASKGPDAAGSTSGDGSSSFDADSSGLNTDATADAGNGEAGSPDASDATPETGQAADAEAGAESGTPEASSPEAAPPAPGSVVWVRQLATQGGWDGRAAMVLDTSSIVVATEFTGIANVGGGNLTSAGGTDMLLARFAQSDGSHQASVRYGGAGDEFPFGLAVASNGTVFVEGDYANATANLGGSDLAWSGVNDDAFIAEYDSGFAHKWSMAITPQMNFGATAGHVASFDPQGLAYAAGKFQGTINFGNGAVMASAGAGNADGFYGAYTNSDNLSAFVDFTGPTAGHYLYMESAIYSSGNVVVGGSYSGQISFNGNVKTAAGPLDALVTSFTAPQGATQWTYTISGSGQESDILLATDSAGHIYVSGTFTQTVMIGSKMLTSAGGTDVFLMRLSSAGAVDWVQSFGGAGNDIALSLASNAAGDIAVSGDFMSTVDFGGGARTSAGGQDIFVAAFSGADGSYRWDHTYGGSSNDNGLAVAVDSGGAVYALALFTSTVDFGTGPLSTGNGINAVLRYAP